MEITKKTLCIDGESLLKRSFHGNKFTYDNDFGYIGAVETFITTVRSLINRYAFNKVIIFWDGREGGKMRWRMYPYYKSNRNKAWNQGELILSDAEIRRLVYLSKQKDEDAIILLQKIRIQQYAEELYFRQFESLEIEADDAIAYYCLNVKEEDEEVVICSGDRDFLQLLSIDNVQLYITDKKDLVNKYNFSLLYFNFHYSNAGLIKSIEGCSSDVIHGVSSIGEKTLLKLFPDLRKRKMTIEEILIKAKEINDGRKKPLVALTNLLEGKTAVELKSVLNGQHLFELNYKLVNLLEPMIDEEAIEALEIQVLSPLDIENRGGKNIIRLMNEDGFIKRIPRGGDGYKDFIISFLPVVKAEKLYTSLNT